MCYVNKIVCVINDAVMNCVYLFEHIFIRYFYHLTALLGFNFGPEFHIKRTKMGGMTTRKKRRRLLIGKHCIQNRIL
jgi:hypothetical protein